MTNVRKRRFNHADRVFGWSRPSMWARYPLVFVYVRILTAIAYNGSCKSSLRREGAKTLVYLVARSIVCAG